MMSEKINGIDDRSFVTSRAVLRLVVASGIVELSGIRVTVKCLYFGVRRFSDQVTCSRRKRGKSSEWLAQLGIRAAVAHHLFLFFCTAGYAVRASLL